MRILFLAPRFPYPPLKGDQVRAYNQIRHLSRNHEIGLVALTDQPVTQNEREEVEKYCDVIEIVKTTKWRALFRAAVGFFIKKDSVNESYFSSPNFSVAIERVVSQLPPDVVHVQLVRLTRYAREVVDVGRSIDFIDALSLNLKRRVERAAPPISWFWREEMGRVRRLEEETLQQFESAFVTSAVDRAHLCVDASASDCQGKVHVIPNGVDLDQFAFGPQSKRESNTILFTGNMSYKPNIDAVKYFVNHIFGKIRAEREDVRFQIAGAKPTATVRALARTDGVEVLGFVSSIADTLHRATLAVCPLQSGAGIQNKVLEAMATGTPVVSTSLAVAGVEGAKPGKHFVLADAKKAFSTAVLQLLDDEERRASMAAAGREFVESEYRWSATVDQMEALLHEARRKGTECF